jgi:hypothetical protein
VLALPLTAATELSSGVRSELEIVLTSLDQKQAEKLAAVWEPKRKLDPDMKRGVKKDLLDLLHRRRRAYEPINLTLEEARSASAAPLRIVIERVAPAKDLKALLALMNGAPPAPKPTPKAAKRQRDARPRLDREWLPQYPRKVRNWAASHLTRFQRGS